MSIRLVLTGINVTRIAQRNPGHPVGISPKRVKHSYSISPSFPGQVLPRAV
ncbi:hypothetical protein [uncultured Amphritea sp.]|uniref:hypothetical protein n=1 Tax=uncultured Amphritea sp. TaxID=981605 RepID=UPI002603E8CF|nr:hypothetical protein [uncultured Amphritea sp.]